MRRDPTAPCTCEQCAPAPGFVDRATLWFGVLALVLMPGRVLAQAIGLLP